MLGVQAFIQTSAAIQTCGPTSWRKKRWFAVCCARAAGSCGLLCIVDFTLVDGMAASQYLGAALDVRLLDAHGDVETDCSPPIAGNAGDYHTTRAAVIEAATPSLSVTSLYVTARDGDGPLRPGKSIASAR